MAPSDSVIPITSTALAKSQQDVLAAVSRVVSRSWFVLGEEVAAFESEFAQYVGTAHCVTVANGTDALELALRAVGVERGSEVVCAANAGFYGSTACSAIGAFPLYVDVDPRSLCIDVLHVEQALARKPAAVIVTHLYGQLADVEAIANLCRQHGVPLIEDCAQAHGALRDGKRAGSFGDVGCFSFYPTKNLGALGDGGCVVTHSERICQSVRAMRQYGWASKYVVEHTGGRNSRLDEIQAAVLRVKLPALDAQNAARRDVAARYNEAFSALPLQTPMSTGLDYVAHLYVVRVNQRDALRSHLKSAGVSTDVHYPVADHLQPVWGTRPRETLPVTQDACDRVLTLPCHPSLSDQAVDRVIAGVRSFFDKGA